MPNNDVNSYPNWNPQGAGAAENFAAPVNLIRIQQAAIVGDAQRLRVPQETNTDQTYNSLWQYVPAFVPLPQSPTHVPDAFTQSRSLLDYARTTVGTSQIGGVDNRGNGGQQNITGTKQ